MKSRHHSLRIMTFNTNSSSYAKTVFLSVIMILMTQVGYADSMDFSIGLDQETESRDTGGSTPTLTPSVEGADLIINEAMTNITFQYGTSAASGSTSSTCIGTACMVKDINASGNSFGTNGWPPFMETIGNTLYFSADDGIYGHNLWKSDGTASGTVMVKDINSGSSSSPMYLTAVGNTLYFNAADGTEGAA